MAGADTVTAGITTADYNDVFVFGVDRIDVQRIQVIACQSTVLLSQIRHGKMNTIKLAAG